MSNFRIQDDLYKAVNQDWIDSAVIPEDRPTAGGFSDLDRGVEAIMMKEFCDMSANPDLIPDDYIKRAIDLYNVVKDVKKRNREGIRPVLKRLSKLQKITDMTSFNRNLKYLVENCYALPFEIGVSEDMKDSTTHAIYLQGPSTILPDTTYYLDEMKEQMQALLGVWSNMISELLSYTRLSEEDQKVYLQDALDFDGVIATLVKSSEEWSEYPKIYNPTKIRTVSSLIKPVKFRKLLVDLFGEDIPENIIVADPRFLKGFNTLFNEETLTKYLHWAYIKELLGATPYLSEKLRILGLTYRKVLSGVQQAPSIEKQAYNLASGMFSEPIGVYYGKKYFGEEAKKDVIEMVHEIIDAYIVRVKNNDFLSEPTKEKAVVKLGAMKVKMGYPDKIDSKYDAYVFDKEASLFTIICEISKIKFLQNLDELKKPTDRTTWVMPGHMVNACYNPSFNDITFPAAILQPPFYSIKQSRSQNLGGIGAVIGHEITHAFDNNGANYDENGNMNNWWTKEDFKKFNAKTKAMIKEFDGIELEWGKVNGAFCVSENIADNGGMAVTLDVMKKTSDADYQEYFKNFARVWCMKARPQYLQLLLSVDVHAPAYLRANMTPRNFDEFYTAFNVKKSDGMYMAPQKRVHIW